MDKAVTVLPQPLSPTRQTVSPAPTASDTPSTARNASAFLPKSIFRLLISSSGVINQIRRDELYESLTQKGKWDSRSSSLREWNCEIHLHNDFVSAASLNPSPRKLKARTVTKIAAPGASSH